MTGVCAADAAGEVDVAVAVDVFEPCVFGFGHVNRRAVRKAPGQGLPRGAVRGPSTWGPVWECFDANSCSCQVLVRIP